MVATVPEVATVVVRVCDQYVAPVGRKLCSGDCPAPRVRAVADCVSLPTPATAALLRVVVNETVGAPVAALAAAVAPMAPDPSLPVGSAPLIATTLSVAVAAEASV